MLWSICVASLSSTQNQLLVKWIPT